MWKKGKFSKVIGDFNATGKNKNNSSRKLLKETKASIKKHKDMYIGILIPKDTNQYLITSNLTTKNHFLNSKPLLPSVTHRVLRRWGGGCVLWLGDLQMRMAFLWCLCGRHFRYFIILIALRWWCCCCRLKYSWSKDRTRGHLWLTDHHNHKRL